MAQDWLASATDSLRENSPVLVVVAIMLVGADGLAVGLGRPERVLDNAGYRGLIAIAVGCLSCVFIIWFLHLTLVRKVSVLTGAAWRHAFGEFISRDRVMLALPVLMTWPVMTTAFTQVKTMIPLAQPFYLDTLLFELDRAMHFGWDPWYLLQPILGYPLVTYAIDRLYALWLFVIYMAVLLQMAACGDRRRRAQFLLSSVLAWMLLGSVGAVLLSSAGPTYFAEVVGGPDPYAPLMNYLRQTVNGAEVSFLGFEWRIELVALNVREILWTSYEQNASGLGRGISAAPSMHVASTWLVARLLQSYGRYPAIFGWSFFAVILVGSVHLGWHYALDGYISIAGAWLIWRAVGWWLDHRAVANTLWTDDRRASRLG